MNPLTNMIRENDVNFCSACGAALAHQAAFCSACGTAVSTLPAGDDIGQPSPAFKVFTKKFVAVLGVVAVLAVGGGTAFAVTRGGGGETFEECLANPSKPNYLCQGLPHENATAAAGDVSEPSDVDRPGTASGTEECYDDESCALAEAGDTEGYDEHFTCVYPQPGIAGMIGVRMSACDTEAEQAAMFGQVRDYIYRPLGRRPTGSEVETTIMTPGTPSYALVGQLFPDPDDAQAFVDWVWESA